MTLLTAAPLSPDILPERWSQAIAVLTAVGAVTGTVLSCGYSP